MPIQIYPSSYKDQPALTLESDLLCAQFLPGTGAKLASLVYKARNFELLVQGPGEEYLLQPFDGIYTGGECTGFDDMFPTIDTCYYDRYPWEGIKMADHGEVWSLPWETRIEDDCLSFAVHGVRFPYTLQKQVTFPHEHILRLDYVLTNHSEFEFDFLWAAHMMINIMDGTELVLPEGIQKIVGAFTLSGDFGKYGEEFDWPVGELADGSQKDFRRLAPRAAKETYKYFVKGRLPTGWCAIKVHPANFSLGVSFPVQAVPYLGILPNSGGWRDYYNIFIEPCTTSFDRPDVGRHRNELSSVKAHDQYRWHLNISLLEGTDFTGFGENGEQLT